ncbi:hypothetical protein BDW59DRAFT_101349 [Aspergillus cavernicola]|uniref:Uncharacterized protein n=1 Tax=Aspergillus cavernicola TaxID=176166 RepID=A0ABR4I5C8_9EURO
MADILGLDEFAQTRGADDLFDDEIIPVAANEQPPPETQVLDEEPVATVVDHEIAPAHTDTPTRPRGGERRGRGKGRGRGGRGAQSAGSRRSGGPRDKSEDAITEPEARNEEETAPESPGDNAEQPEDTAASASAEAPRVPAVRGDRSATGGVKKPKLTEEELSQRIAAARENAAKKAAAHARAEADQASFEEREKVAEKKRREERQNRRVMDTEREQNRQRKLGAMNGREWDAEKPEDQFSSRGGRGQFRRGMHGGVSGYTRRGFEEDSHPGEESPDTNDTQPQGYRGRGRGRGGRGGRGRGGHRGQDRSSGENPSEVSSKEKVALSIPVISNEMEFPSLPGEKKKGTNTDESAPAPDNKLKPLSPISGSPWGDSGATWADQVEDQRE